ncbi:MAG: hypothetical protein SFW65_09285 [Alphaproteobacteria bacterium]|nr:hypothetical protein [Alphaproteobacteria bacterium]
MKYCVAMVVLLCAAIFVPTNSYAQLSPEATLVSGSEIPLQGSCKNNGLNPDELGISGKNATLSCTGKGTDMLNLFYSDGTFDKCVYIDNLDPNNKALFIPVRTSQEWLAFKNTTQRDGNLHNKVRMTYGCEAGTITDPCSMGQTFPRGRNGAQVTFTSKATKILNYTCIATTKCGVWTLTSSTGTCPVNGACGEASTLPAATAPTSNLCNAGTAGHVSQSETWNWQCKGLNGGKDTSCQAIIQRDGLCGKADGGLFAEPPLSNLCEMGTPTEVSQSATRFNWDCIGENNGIIASCSANYVNGDGCGPAAGRTYSRRPHPFNLCALNWTRVGKMAVTADTYEWRCKTVHSPRLTVSCSADRNPVSCGLPWGGAIDSGESVTAYATPHVQCGDSCIPETRSCNEGVLSGSYDKKSCAMLACDKSKSKEGCTAGCH